MTGGISVIPDRSATSAPLQYDSSVTLAFPLGQSFEWFVDATASTAFAPIARSGTRFTPAPVAWQAKTSFDVFGGDAGLAFKPTPAAYLGLALGLAQASATVDYTTRSSLVPSQTSFHSLLARVTAVAGYKFQLNDRMSLITEVRLRYGKAIATDNTHRCKQLFQISPQTGVSIGF